MNTTKTVIFFALCALSIPSIPVASASKKRTYASVTAIAALAYLSYTYNNQAAATPPPPVEDIDPAYPTTLFSHGITDNFTQAYKYINHLFSNHVYPVHYPDGSIHWLGRYMYAYKTSLGQTDEIQLLAQGYNNLINTTRDTKKIVITGVSRGASVALTLFLNKSIDTSRIGALVLESPYDCASSVAKHIGAKMRRSNLSETTCNRLLQTVFPNYKPNKEHPIEAIDKIPSDMPILIVATKQDSIVPYESSLNLYNKLKKTGHKNVHFLGFETGKHSKIITGNPVDAATYKNAVHAFYKRYGLRHDPAAAQAGAPALTLHEATA